MKISIQWLNDYVEHKLKTQELAHRLTMAGLEVEDIEDAGHTQVFQIEVTPNRPDCLSVVGMAREVSAICQKPLKTPKIKTYKNTKEKVSVAIENREDCGRYIATVIRNVHVGESPKWLKDRIEALGMRSINNVVDITNFCLMELGQPLHAFDYDKLEEKRIVVRRGKKGEEIRTLDGQPRKVDENILVIADARRPVAIAGIMGGEATQITSGTKNILLESAHFSQGLIRRSARTLGLTSDSAYRFERGVHWDTIERGANRAIDLILELAGGTVELRTDVVVQRPKTVKKSISVSQKEIEGLIGTPLPLAKCKNILTKLAFGVTTKGKDSLTVAVPDFRNDVTQPVDIIEEVARIIGFDNLPMTLPLIKASNIAVDKTARSFKKAMYGRLMAQGYNEIVTYSMTNQKSLEKSSLSFAHPLRIVNPLSQDQELMRPSLLPGFLSVALSNVNHGEKNLRFFEFGRTYMNGAERDVLGVLLTGVRNQDWRLGKKETADFYDLKGALEDVLSVLSSKVHCAPIHAQGFEAGQCSQIILNGVPVGFLGRVAADALQKWDIKTSGIFFAQLELDIIFEQKRSALRFLPIVEFPSVVRDVSLAVKNDVAYEQIKAICEQEGGGFLRSVRLVEQYVGDKIQSGHRGIVFSLVYQSDKGTLKEEDVARTHERICQALINSLGAVRR